MKKFLTLVLTTFFCFPLLFAQNGHNPWQDANEPEFAKEDMERQIIPQSYRTVQLDLDALNDILRQAPMWFSEEAETKKPNLSIPMPDGSFHHFTIVEAPVMHPALAKKYPGMKSYAGWSQEDPTAYLRFGVTPIGFHGLLLSARHSSVYIDAYAKGNKTHYTCYYKKDYARQDAFECLVDEFPATKEIPEPQILKSFAGDCTHRTYDLALACTGEYAQYHGGTKSDVMAEFNIAMTRVNGIYEREVGVTMIMVPNNDDLIFLNASTDPYTNNNGATMLGQNQETCDDIIGDANYGIGHVFSTGGGGIANLRSVCRPGFKARGVTGLPNPVGDPFYVDYVCHEMGHQFGGNHTQNNSCNRSGPTAMEPGSASTIMGYAGICVPNVQNNSDDYFHAINLDEMASHLTGPTGNSCPTSTSTNNDPPSITVPGAFYHMPVSTPFVLTAEGEDPDGNSSLTYCWEQMDNEVATMPPTPTNSGGPAFRSLTPVESPSRYFPNLNAILAGSTPTWEVLPSVNRMMNFRCTVRDNHPGGGCTAETDVTLSFTASAGPFRVTEPNTSAVTWTASSTATVTWSVAGTSNAPVSTSQVEIFLSEDGGLTYPYVLSAGTPNDGEQTVLVPFIETDEARVMVKGLNHVFFDISDQNFTIELPAVPTFVVTGDPASQTTCRAGQVEYAFDLQPVLGFTQPVTFNASGVPAGATVFFSPNSVVPPATVTLTVGNLEDVAAGTYTLDIEAVSSPVIRNTSVELVVLDSVTSEVTLVSPPDGATGLNNFQVDLSWDPLNAAGEYIVEVSGNPSFQNLFFTDTLSGNTTQIPPLNNGSTYYWRVKGKNICNEGPFSQTFAFQAGGLDCEQYASEDVPVPISPFIGGTVTSTLSIPLNNPLASLYVYMDIDHTYIGDIDAILTSPEGTAVALFDQPGVPQTTFGCDDDNMEVGFADDAPNTAEDLENTCNSTPPAISGDFQPVEPLASFTGENIQGEWELSVEDFYPQADGGAINSWYLEICVSNPFPPAILLQNDTLLVPEGQSETITSALLQADDSAGEVTFTLLSMPVNGTLSLMGNTLTIGSNFTQTNVDQGELTYTHDDSMTQADAFRFDVTDAVSGWLHDQTFHIRIVENPILASAIITQEIDCHNNQNAIITVSTSGGNPPYTYSLNGGPFQSNPSFVNLGPGTYDVAVMDNDGSTIATNSLTIVNPPAINLNATVLNDDITVVATGGTGTLQYSIDGTNFQTNPVFENLPNGTYTITVRDENGCTETTTATVSVNMLILSASVIQPVSCNSGHDGVITASAAGGNPPYEYSIDGITFQNDPVFSNLSAGTYDVIVRDNDGFTQLIQVILEEPPAITGSASANGYEVTVAATGGTGMLQYSLDGGPFQNDPVFYPVPGGNYTVTVVDENDCPFSTQVTVNVPALGATLSLVAAPSCWNTADAQIMAVASGGVPPYEYSLNGGPFQSNDSFSNLPAGSYQVTIRDSGGFNIASNEVEITAPPALNASASVSGNDITVSATGGTPPFMYQLGNGAFQTSNVFENLSNGSYTITVQDENGCETTTTATVNVPSLQILAIIEQEVSCAEGTDGIIVLQVSGGIPPYQYSLDGVNFQTGNEFQGLPAGTYQPVVLDADGNTVSAPAVIIQEPPAVVASASAFGPEITITASGGTGMLEYSLEGGTFQSGNIFEVVSNGTYTVTIKDENGCTADVQVLVNKPEELLFSTTSISCADASDGMIEIAGVNGGYPPYLFSLNGGPLSTSLVYSDLPAGEYQFTVVDSTGYEWPAPPILIDAPPPIDLSTDVVGQTITINASGGTSPYEYSLDGGTIFQDENIFTDLPNGTYLVTVRDANGCTAQITAEVNMNAVGETEGNLAFFIFPNPGNGQFSLAFNAPLHDKLDITVSDVTGRTVYSGESESPANTLSLDLGFLSNGNYQLRITDGEKWGVRRLVIVK